MPTPFQPELLLPILQGLPPASRYWIAYSGGLDSSVLLHALSQLGTRLAAPISAIHVDHGLALESARWSEQCRSQCEQLGVALHEMRVEVRREGRGLEAAAREARYAAFASVVDAGEMLLTAHHQDDQVETLLLQLLRGGAVRGLAAMPQHRPLADGWLGRPLLGFSRQALQAYATQQGLGWIDDPSNFDTSLQRNYLRHELLPMLQQRQPGVSSVLARSAGHFAESAALLDELAAMDLEAVGVAAGRCLSIESLRPLSAARQRNLLRHWLRQQGLTIPDSRNLQRILDEVVVAAQDAEPLVGWHGGEVRRYRERLYAMVPLPPRPGSQLTIPWRGEATLVLPGGLGQLRARSMVGQGIRESLLQQEVVIGWRRGGERIVLQQRGGHHELKKLYQEAGVPPWERSRRPLLWLQGELAEVVGLWRDSRYVCGEGEKGICFEWLPGIEMVGENNDN